MSEPVSDAAINEYFPRIAVAAVDALGIRSLVARRDDARSAAEALGLLARNASARWIYDATDLKSKKVALYDLDAYFGDSVYLFGNPTDSLEKQVFGLVARVASLLAISFFVEAPLLIRAGIGVGDLRRRVVRSDGGDREIRIGTAMICAREMEESQEWIGAAVHANAPLENETKRWISDFTVPLKPTASALAGAAAILWIPAGKPLSYVSDLVETRVRDVGTGNSGVGKLKNTQEFIGHVYAANQFPPMQWPDV